MSLTSRNVSAVKHAESAFYSDPKSCITGFVTTTAKRQLLRTHYLYMKRLRSLCEAAEPYLCYFVVYHSLSTDSAALPYIVKSLFSCAFSGGGSTAFQSHQKKPRKYGSSHIVSMTLR